MFDVGSLVRVTMVKIHIILAHLSTLMDKCIEYFLVAILHLSGNYKVHMK